ncbi:aldo/keto reductase [Plantactinospora sp. S1510]|uniref:Aldo/keto reductase n=1 Tax=Plantactinospora alkalitolerans TaxID=2789879 RepID=A0ABS0GTZ1_9ACTN|nr:aldo/keto reductase [Plantactinospora alkalitolerans]MBF9129666.1 aldo/keto reductase [Plantactinospora alkalitolerans]
MFGIEEEAVSRSRLDAYAGGGGRTIDTAPMYADGLGEEVIGRWLADQRPAVPREDWQIISKVCHPEDGRSRVRPDVIRAEVAGSLRRLRTDYLDAVLLHRDDPDVPVNAITDTLLELHDRGTVRQLGVSNWSAGRLADFADAVAPLKPIASYQFSLAVPTGPIWPDTRHVTADVLEVVVERGLCLQGWTALARGWFAGRNPDDRTGIDRKLLLLFDTPANRAAREVVFSIARKRDVAPIAVALSWMLSASLDVHAVLAPRSAEQLRECFGGLEFTLTSAEWAELSRAAGVTSVPGPASERVRG